MQIMLSPDEASELRELLDSTLKELHSEIFHTDTPAFKQRLQQRERLLSQLRERLDGGGAQG